MLITEIFISINFVTGSIYKQLLPIVFLYLEAFILTSSSSDSKLINLC